MSQTTTAIQSLHVTDMHITSHFHFEVVCSAFVQTVDVQTVQDRNSSQSGGSHTDQTAPADSQGYPASRYPKAFSDDSELCLCVIKLPTLQMLL